MTTAVRTLILVMLISSCSMSDSTTDLGQNYIFVSESNANQFISGPDDSLGVYTVPCTVKAFEFDSNFIIATQAVNLQCLDTTPTDLKIQYWIITKKNRMSFGPLDSLSYSKKRQELNVPTALSL